MKKLFFLITLPFALFAHPMNDDVQTKPTSQTTDFYCNPTGNPSFYPKQPTYFSPFVSAEFTYWQINSINLGFYRDGERNIPGTTISQGKVYQVEPHWEPGFKIALGGVLPHGGWDILARYTYVNYNNGKSGDAAPLAGLSSDSIGVGNGAAFREIAPTSAKGYASARVNIIDAELGRKFFNSRYLAFRYFVGLRSIWGKSQGRSTFFYELTNSATRLDVDNVAVTGPVMVREKGSSWSLGPRVGLETNFFFCTNLSIFGRAAFNPAYVNFDVQRSVVVYDRMNPSTTTTNIKNTGIDVVSPFAEVQLGLEGEVWLYDNDYRLAFKLLYEVQTWPGMRPRSTTQTNGGAMDGHGLTASASFQF